MANTHFLDNEGFVTATQRLLNGDPTPSLKDNRDLWGRVTRRLHVNQKNIQITWIKGHAEDKHTAEGSSSVAHKHGNDSADLLANAGSKLIELPPLLHKGHELKRHIVIAIQAMFLACYTRRQTKRQELALETLLERELEGAPDEQPPGPPVANPLLEAMFAPAERAMSALAGQRIKDRFPEYVWVNFDAPTSALLRAGVEWPMDNACFRKPQWQFPLSLIDPLIWYWTKLRFYDEPTALVGKYAVGVSWLELAMDFEIATRIPLSYGGPDNATELMRQRAVLMAYSSKSLLRGLGSPLTSCHREDGRSIVAFRSSPRAGVRNRPALLCPEAVGYELGMQVMLHPALMGVWSTQWKWRPNLRFLPQHFTSSHGFLTNGSICGDQQG